MRILVVSNGYPPRGQWGTEFYTAELVRGLRVRGHELSVLHPERSGTRPRYTLERVVEDGVELLLLHNQGDPKKSFADSYTNARVEELVRAELRRLRPDVVHFTYLLWGLSVRLPEIARAEGAATVVTLTDYGLLCHRGQMFDHRLERCFGPHPAATCARCIREPSAYDHSGARLVARRAAVRVLAAAGGVGRVVVTGDVAARESAVRRAFEHVDHFVAPTRNVEEIFRGAGVPAERLTRLCYAFDETPYAALRGRAPEQPPRIGFLGQFGPHKGLATLVAAAELAARRRPELAWEVVLHGAPSPRHARYAPEVLARADPRRVRRAPAFAMHEAPGVIAALSAVALPAAWDENAPLSLLQARALGVPVLASDVPGISEIVEHGRHGRLFPVGDAAALAEAIEAVAEGRLGRVPAGLPLSLAAHLEGLEQLYRAACEERARA